jgi:hypothetical protein
MEDQQGCPYPVRAELNGGTLGPVKELVKIKVEFHK